MSRAEWDTYFMNLAYTVATRSTCPRRSVGAIIVVENRIIGTGYNGSLSGQPHCKDVGCQVMNDHCVMAVHAEVNAILSCAKHGIKVDGATLYTTTAPCLNCYKSAYQSGIQRILYDTVYGPLAEDTLKMNKLALNMTCAKIQKNTVSAADDTSIINT